MIPIPKFSQLPLDGFFAGSVGYALGSFVGVNEKLSAEVLVIASLANQILFHLANASCLRSHFSAEAVYTGTNTLVTLTTIVSARYLELISRRSVGMLMFASFAILAARLKLLAE